MDVIRIASEQNLSKLLGSRVIFNPKNFNPKKDQKLSKRWRMKLPLLPKYLTMYSLHKV